MKPSCVGMCKDKPTHVHLCNPIRSRKMKSRNISAAGARETQNRLPRKRKHYRSRLAHASNFSFCVPYERVGALRASHRGRSALPICIRKTQTPKYFCQPTCCLLPVTIMDCTVSIHLRPFFGHFPFFITVYLGKAKSLGFL
jgi:hypothetical protein